jgi:2,3-dihydroxybiphenyl 1,2-dioxygenase
MTLQAFGYFGVGSPDLEDWEQFGSGLLGFQTVERTKSLLSFRMDDRKQRFVVDRELPAGSRFFGWEVASAAALDVFAARLEHLGITYERAPRWLAEARRVAALISFADPAGNRLEVFHGAEMDCSPFRPGRAISGFRTGPLGLGHAVLSVQRIDDVLEFYIGALGFRLSDYILKPFKAYFMHINGRHHSLALIEGRENGIHHLMVELFSLDDVGQAHDIASLEEGRVAVTLGRHTNDYMTSFYAKTPSAFMIEYGWGGREIEPDAWTPVECKDGPSLWGHERTWLSAEQRSAARDMRLKAAAEGLRHPVQVLAGNYRPMKGTCPWWDSIAPRELQEIFETPLREDF